MKQKCKANCKHT